MHHPSSSDSAKKEEGGVVGGFESHRTTAAKSAAPIRPCPFSSCRLQLALLHKDHFKINKDESVTLTRDAVPKFANKEEKLMAEEAEARQEAADVPGVWGSVSNLNHHQSTS